MFSYSEIVKQMHLQQNLKSGLITRNGLRMLFQRVVFFEQLMQKTFSNSALLSCSEKFYSTSIDFIFRFAILGLLS